ncbi:hypothetical protein ACV229_16905 [Burkholderia sp. MR1-5-21]
MLKVARVNYLVVSVVSVAMLGACASKPQIEYDAQKMSAIKTIAVNVPKPTKYFAVSAGGPIFVPIPGVGLIAAAIGGAIAGGAAAVSTRTNKDFDSLVKSQLGDTRLNGKYIEALEAELRAQGYQVKEIDLDQDGMPKIAGDWLHPTLKGGAYAGADAIMIAPNTTGYGANGLGWPYVRTVNSQIRIFKADTLEPIFSQNIFFKIAKDPYSYPFYSDLVKDLPHAIQGVDEALMSVVPQFRQGLLVSRGVSQVTDAGLSKKEN